MHNLNSIPLSALRAVEAIARTGTLNRAADELGITAGALSQRLSKAEASLGQELFIRTSTGMTPTKICTEVAPRLTRAMSELSGVVADIRAPEENVLTVSVAPIFASRWLVWRIKKFHDQNPGISLRVLPTTEIVELDRSDVDIGIRVGADPKIGAGATKLLDQRVFPVCAPGMASRLKRLDDLATVPVIRENENLHGWREWLADQARSTSVLLSGPTYADASLCLDAAMAGQGVFMAWETLACDALARGQVAAPFDHRAQTGSTYWFATSRSSARKPSVKKFKSWLDAELACFMEFWQNTQTDGTH
ncbi:LysR family transcriptional regulator [Actibacterium mucosum KCTC 23349]|uniref:LysR family transcriptional regulator n=1 Tax=Actibacterium mucosum KCTC 23349 TaxID=1454373 RepID=A0A037ZFH1_9RHOB|nr:LysR substrate-binding domain-containing protein [Actibacterium mucosum]KAJ55230.1 LysR family transcriptional regulator [Actibacterium mucosum KCTC 23349]